MERYIAPSTSTRRIPTRCPRSRASFARSTRSCDRDRLIADGHLLPNAQEKGTDLQDGRFRTPRGSELLLHAKDVLFGLLFGDEATNTRLARIQRELLTLALPRTKADALDFMKATTDLSALGTWQDPDRVVND